MYRARGLEGKVCRGIVNLAFLAGAAILATCRPVFAQLVWEDGTFVQPHPLAGAFTLYDTGNRIGAWRVVGEQGNIMVVPGTYRHNGFNFTAQGAGGLKTKDLWVNLAGISRSRTGLAHRAVPTSPGTIYTLTFYVGTLHDPSGIYGTSSSVVAYENDKPLGTFTNDNVPVNKDVNWKPFRVKFKADAPYTTIAFINGDGPGDWMCGLDNTNLFPTPPSQEAKP